MNCQPYLSMLIIPLTKPKIWPTSDPWPVRHKVTIRIASPKGDLNDLGSNIIQPSSYEHTIRYDGRTATYSMKNRVPQAAIENTQSFSKKDPKRPSNHENSLWTRLDHFTIFPAIGDWVPNLCQILGKSDVHPRSTAVARRCLSWPCVTRCLGRVSRAKTNVQ